MKPLNKQVMQKDIKTSRANRWKSQSKDAASALALVIFLSACQTAVEKQSSVAAIKPEKEVAVVQAEKLEEKVVKQEMLEQVVTAKMVLSAGSTNALLSNTYEQEIKNFIGSLAAWHSIDKVKVVGHTDSVGSTVSNERLSVERAKAVVSKLTALGLDKQIYQIQGKGETEPAVDNATIPGRAKNRRVEVEVEGIILKKATEVAVKTP